MYAFENFTGGTLNHLLYYLNPISCIKDKILYKEGDIADCFYIIINPEGSVELSKMISLEENVKNKDFKDF